MNAAAEELRDLVADDASALARFFRANHDLETTALFHPFPLTQTEAERIAQHTGRDRYFALFRGAAIVAFAMLRGWDDGFAVPSFGVLVDARARGCGHGRRLTQHALEIGGPRVRLTVSPGNTRAVALYQELGFVTTETLPDGRLVMHWERVK